MLRIPRITILYPVQIWSRERVFVQTLCSVRPQMVDFGSEQGLSNFETATIAGYVEDFKRAKTPLWAKGCRLWMDTMWQSEYAKAHSGHPACFSENSGV